MHNVTNNSTADQGVWGVDGLVIVAPKATRPIDIKPEYLERAMSLPFLTVESADPLDHDDNGEKGSSKPADPPGLTGKSKADLLRIAVDEGVYATDDMTNSEIRAAIEAARS